MKEYDYNYDYTEYSRRSQGSPVQWIFWTVVLLTSFVTFAAMFLPWGELTTTLKMTLKDVSLDGMIGTLNFKGILNAYRNLKEFDGSGYSILMALLDLKPIISVMEFTSKILLIMAIAMAAAMVLNLIYVLGMIFRAKRALPVLTVFVIIGDAAAWGASKICFYIVNTRIKDQLNELSIFKQVENTMVNSIRLVDVGIGGWVVLACAGVAFLMLILALISRSVSEK